MHGIYIYRLAGHTIRWTSAICGTLEPPTDSVTVDDTPLKVVKPALFAKLSGLLGKNLDNPGCERQRERFYNLLDPHG